MQPSLVYQLGYLCVLSTEPAIVLTESTVFVAAVSNLQLSTQQTLFFWNPCSTLRQTVQL